MLNHLPKFRIELRLYISIAITIAATIYCQTSIAAPIDCDNWQSVMNAKGDDFSKCTAQQRLSAKRQYASHHTKWSILDTSPKMESVFSTNTVAGRRAEIVVTEIPQYKMPSISYGKETIACRARSCPPIKAKFDDGQWKRWGVRGNAVSISVLDSTGFYEALKNAQIATIVLPLETGNATFKFDMGSYH